MPKVIEFYDSDSLAKTANYKARKEPGKLIEFHASKGNQVNSHSAQWPGMCMAYIAPFAETLGAEMATSSGPQAKRLGNPDKELL
jgi:hypothetical protein